MDTDLIVVIPGITGTALHEAGGRAIWDRSLGAVLHGLSHWRDPLSNLRLPDDLGDDAPADASITVGAPIGGWHLWPGLASGGGYRRLVGALRMQAPDAVREFGYDWRLSNRHTARLLRQRTGEWLADRRVTTGDPDAKVTLVCHSMGGLIARYYLEVLGGWETTRRVVTMGTPYSGSVKAVAALTGDLLADVPRGDEITAVMRTFPALYQLLPVYRCVAGDEPLRLTETSVPGLPTAFVREAFAFHAELARAAEDGGIQRYLAFGGRGQATLQSISMVGGRLRYDRCQRGVDHGGDGTVARFSAVPTEWNDTSDAQFHAVRHSNLPCSSPVIDAVADRLWPIDLGSTLAPEVELGLDLPEAVSTRDGIPITVEAARPDLLLVARVRDPGTGEIVEEVPAPPDGYGRYAARVTPPAGVWRIEVATLAELPPVMIDEYVCVLDD